MFVCSWLWQMVIFYNKGMQLFIGNTSISVLSLLPQIAEQLAASKQITHTKPFLRKSIKLTDSVLINLFSCSILHLHALVAEAGISAIKVLLFLLHLQRYSFLPSCDKHKGRHQSHHILLKLQGYLFALEAQHTIALLSLDLLLYYIVLDLLTEQHVGEDV